MKIFRVIVQRTQIQSNTFVVSAKNQSELKKKLDEIDFGEMDEVFDEGEVDSIEYDVVDSEPCDEDEDFEDDII